MKRQYILTFFGGRNHVFIDAGFSFPHHCQLRFASLSLHRSTVVSHSLSVGRGQHRRRFQHVHTSAARQNFRQNCDCCWRRFVAVVVVVVIQAHFRPCLRPRCRPCPRPRLRPLLAFCTEILRFVMADIVVADDVVRDSDDDDGRGRRQSE